MGYQKLFPNGKSKKCCERIWKKIEFRWWLTNHQISKIESFFIWSEQNGVTAFVDRPGSSVHVLTEKGNGLFKKTDFQALRVSLFQWEIWRSSDDRNKMWHIKQIK